jgi:Flp pilus assembly protein TadB
MLADIGSAIECFGCLPWWLILILAIHPLFKFLEKRDDIKRAVEEWKKENLKRKQKVWFFWFLFLVVLALIFYLIEYWCIPWWLLILLILISVSLRFLFNEGRKDRKEI